MKSLTQLRAAAIAAVMLAGVAGAFAQQSIERNVPVPPVMPTVNPHNVGRYIPTYVELSPTVKMLIITDTATGVSKMVFGIWKTKDESNGFAQKFGMPFADLPDSQQPASHGGTDFQEVLHYGQTSLPEPATTPKPAK